MQKDTSTLLSEIKAKSGLSEQAIASRIGTSQPTVNRILRGKTDCKSSTLRAIEQLHGELVTTIAPPKASAQASQAPAI